MPIALIAIVVVPAALIGLIIYLGIRHPSGIFLVAVVIDAVIVIQAAHRVVLNLAAKQPRSAEDVVNRLGLTAQLIAAVVVTLAAVGQLRGWMHGRFEDAIVGIMTLYLIGALVYWLGGKRRLIAALRTRIAGDEPGP